MNLIGISIILYGFLSIFILIHDAIKGKKLKKMLLFLNVLEVLIGSFITFCKIFQPQKTAVIIGLSLIVYAIILFVEKLLKYKVDKIKKISYIIMIPIYFYIEFYQIVGMPENFIDKLLFLMPFKRETVIESLEFRAIFHVCSAYSIFGLLLFLIIIYQVADYLLIGDSNIFNLMISLLFSIISSFLMWYALYFCCFYFICIKELIPLIFISFLISIVIWIILITIDIIILKVIEHFNY